MDFVSDTSRFIGGGKKRTIVFESGNSDLEVLTAPGMFKNEFRVAVKQGLPNTSSESQNISFKNPIFWINFKLNLLQNPAATSAKTDPVVKTTPTTISTTAKSPNTTSSTTTPTNHR